MVELLFVLFAYNFFLDVPLNCSPVFIQHTEREWEAGCYFLKFFLRYISILIQIIILKHRLKGKEYPLSKTHLE